MGRARAGFWRERGGDLGQCEAGDAREWLHRPLERDLSLDLSYSQWEGSASNFS